MTIAYLDVIHNLRFTRTGSRKHEEFNVTTQVPVEIRDLSSSDVEHVGTLTYEGLPRRRIHAWEGTLLTPVTDDKGTGVPVASLTDFRAKNGLMLGKALDWNGSALHGWPTLARRSELPIGRVLSDAFPESKLKVELVGQRLVGVDGILHERTHPPAWVAYVTARNDEVIVHTVESAYPDEIPHIGGGRNVQMFCADDTDATGAYADAMAEASGLPVRWCPTGLEVIDAAAMRFDAAALSAATTLRKAVSGVTRQGAPALQHLDDRALTSFMAVRRAANASPGDRPSLVEARDILAEYAEVLDAQPRIEGHPLAGFRTMLAEVSGEARAFVMRHDACETLSPEGEEDARFLSAL